MPWGGAGHGGRGPGPRGCTASGGSGLAEWGRGVPCRAVPREVRCVLAVPVSSSSHQVL